MPNVMRTMILPQVGSWQVSGGGFSSPMVLSGLSLELPTLPPCAEEQILPVPAEQKGQSHSLISKSSQCDILIPNLKSTICKLPFKIF